MPKSKDTTHDRGTPKARAGKVNEPPFNPVPDAAKARGAAFTKERNEPPHIPDPGGGMEKPPKDDKPGPGDGVQPEPPAPEPPRELLKGGRVKHAKTGRARPGAPEEIAVTQQTLPEGLPAGVQLRLKRRVSMVEGHHYIYDGEGGIIWLKPVPVGTEVSAHDPETGELLWEWSALRGDTEEA